MPDTLSALVAAALWTTVSAASAQVVVPDHYASIQGALEAAPPNGVVLVRAGYTQPHETLVITKPVSLVGEVEIVLTAHGCLEWSEGPVEAIRLDGPGSGTVRLINVSNEGLSVDCLQPPAAVAGGGFDQLQLYDCDLVGTFGNVTGGAGQAGPGLDVDVGQVVIVDSRVRGGFLNFGLCAPQFHDGSTAVRAPGATVIAVDSEIVGGEVAWTMCCGCACPDDLSAMPGRGGVGIEAAVVFDVRATIAGGKGADVVATTNPGGEGLVFCDQLAAGDALQVSTSATVGGPILVSSAGLAQLGQPFVLECSPGTTSGPRFLYASPDVGSPTSTPYGLAFLDLQALSLMATLGHDDIAVTLAVPDLPWLVGHDITLQLWSSTEGLSTPLMTAIVP